MGSTFLSLTNSVLRHFGEVELTSSNFSSATGFHAVAKDAVRDAIRVIQQTEYEWPFNHQTATVTLTATHSATLGITQVYALPTGTISAESVDWESFHVKRNDDLSPTVKERSLPYKSYDEWLRTYRSRDQNISYTSTDIREPEFVFRDQASNLGVSPPADRRYSLKYEFWGYETDLSAYSDTTSVPSRFDHVIRQGAFARCYQHREDIANYNISNKRFTEGITKMRQLLIPPPVTMRDNRVGSPSPYPTAINV